MRFSAMIMIAAIVLVAACTSDGTTSSKNGAPIDARLVAVAQARIVRPGDALVLLDVSVRSNLPETVSTAVCAETVEAKTVSGGTWTDVTATSVGCIAIAAILAPGASMTVSASADPAKIQAVRGLNREVLLRVRHSFVSSTSSTRYVLQSNEVTVTMN